MKVTQPQVPDYSPRRHGEHGGEAGFQAIRRRKRNAFCPQIAQILTD